MCRMERAGAVVQRTQNVNERPASAACSQQTLVWGQPSTGARAESGHDDEPNAANGPHHQRASTITAAMQRAVMCSSMWGCRHCVPRKQVNCAPAHHSTTPTASFCQSASLSPTQIKATQVCRQDRKSRSAAVASEVGNRLVYHRLVLLSVVDAHSTHR